MGKRIKYLLWGLVAIIVPLVVIYCWLAFGPTGYGQIEAQGATALARADEMLRAPGPAPIKEPAPVTDRVTTGTAAKPEEQPVVLGEAIRKVDLGFGDAQQQVQKTLDLEKIESANGPLWYYFLRQVSIFTSPTGLADNPLGFEYLDPEDFFTQTGGRLQSRPDLWLYLNGLSARPLYPDQPATTTEGVRRRREIREALRGPITASLDATERFLLADWRTPGFNEFREGPAGMDRPPWCGPAAVLRAARRGEGAKATRLLERYIEILCILDRGLFPQVNRVEYAGLQQLMLILSDCPGFPREGFLRASDALRRARLTPDDLAVLRRANAARLARELQGGVNSAVYDVSNRKSNSWHFFLDGNLENWAARGLKPVLARRSEQLAVAYAEGKPEQIGEALRPILQLERLINMKEGSIGPSWVFNYFIGGGIGQLSEWVGKEAMRDPAMAQVVLKTATRMACAQTSGEGINDKVDFTRVVLAAAFYRRDHGRWPRSGDELGPDYLDRADLKNEGAGWAIETLPPGSRLELTYGGMGQTRQKIKQFLKKEHRWPQSAEELRPYAASDEEIEGIRRSLRPVTTPERIYIAHFRRQRRPELAVKAYSYERSMTPEEREALKRQAAAGQDEREVIRVQFLSPADPLLSEDLADLLR